MQPNPSQSFFSKRFAGWFPAIRRADQAALNDLLVYTNIARLRIVAWLLIASMFVFIAIQLAYVDRVESLRILAIAPHVMFLRLGLIVGAVAFLVIAGTPASPDAVNRRHHYLESGYILFNLIAFATLSALIQSSGPGVASSYIMAVLVTAAFLDLPWPKSLLIYTPGWGLLSLMLWHFQPDWIIALSAWLNATSGTILALVISQVSHANRVREFLDQRTIQLQQEELRTSNEILKQLSYLDPLTNIPNRRVFDEFLSRAWRSAVREQHMLSLIIADVDHFKPFNDTFGHQAGDEVLVKVAATLSESVKRPRDLIARYGGEEFVAVLPGTDLAGARHVAERMRRSVEELDIKHKSSPYGRLTISLGLACLDPRNADLPETLLSAADEALYRAKKAWGNRWQ